MPSYKVSCFGFLLAGVLFGDAFASPDETVTDEQKVLLEDAIDRFGTNLATFEKYCVAGNIATSDFVVERNPKQHFVVSLFVICFDGNNSFRRVSLLPESIGENGSVLGDWRTEVTRKGSTKSWDEHNQERNGPYRRSEMKFDPFELCIGSFHDFQENSCTPGLFFSIAEIDSIVTCVETEHEIVYVSQRSPECRQQVTLSKRQGLMPIRSSQLICWDTKGKKTFASSNSKDYNKVIGETYCKWKKYQDAWLPVRIQMDETFGKPSSQVGFRHEIEMNWLVGDKLLEVTHDQFEKELPQKLFDYVENNSNVRMP